MAKVAHAWLQYAMSAELYTRCVILFQLPPVMPDPFVITILTAPPICSPCRVLDTSEILFACICLYSYFRLQGVFSLMGIMREAPGLCVAQGRDEGGAMGSSGVPALGILTNLAGGRASQCARGARRGRRLAPGPRDLLRRAGVISAKFQ